MEELRRPGCSTVLRSGGGMTIEGLGVVFNERGMLQSIWSFTRDSAIEGRPGVGGIGRTRGAGTNLLAMVTSLANVCVETSFEPELAD